MLTSATSAHIEQPEVGIYHGSLKQSRSAVAHLPTASPRSTTTEPSGNVSKSGVKDGQRAPHSLTGRLPEARSYSIDRWQAEGQRNDKGCGEEPWKLIASLLESREDSAADPNNRAKAISVA